MMNELPAHSTESELELLIIDDDHSTRMMLSGALKRRGYHIREAADGEQGLRAFCERRPALVLLDVVMPVLDGFAACTRMRELDPKGGRVQPAERALTG